MTNLENSPAPYTTNFPPLTHPITLRQLCYPTDRLNLTSRRIKELLGRTPDVPLPPDFWRNQMRQFQQHDPDATNVLFEQTHLLDHIFTKLLEKCIDKNGLMDEKYMAFALRAQTQCRVTAKTLKSIRTLGSVYPAQ